MPKNYAIEVTRRAEELFTKDGCGPTETLDRLRTEAENGDLLIPGYTPGNDDVADFVPTSRTTIYEWSKDWGSSWKEARRQQRQAIETGEPFAISGITDPIFHLARVKAFSALYKILPQQPDASNGAILADVQRYVDQEVAPGPRVHRELQPILTKHLNILREAIAFAQRGEQSPESMGWVHADGAVEGNVIHLRWPGE